MKKEIFLLALFFVGLVYAQDKAAITGVLTDKETNDQPLPFANVIIKGTTTGTTSDFDGKYILENLEPGDYIIEFSFVGYTTIEKQLTLQAGKTTEINVSLSPSAAVLDDVVIKASSTKRESVQALLVEQKNAIVQKQSIGAQELFNKGVSNAAAAVTKISGISKQEGGGGNVYVRGLGDRYLNTTFNGLSLPSNDIDKKNMDLGLFASDVIQNIGVSKTYAVDFYGDFAAGNVNIKAKEHSGKGFIDADLGNNINTASVGKRFLRSEGTGFFGFYNRYRNNPFAVILSHGVDPIVAEGPLGLSGSISAGKSWEIGEESKLSVFATASFGSNYEYRRGQEANVTRVVNQVFGDTEVFEYSRTTTAMINMVYRINTDHKIKFNSLFINDATDEVGRYGIDGKGYNRNTIIGEDDFGFYTQNVQFEQDMIFVNQITGTSKINDKIKVDYGIGLNNVLARQPDRKRIALEEYDLALDNDPNTNPVLFRNVDFDNQRYFQNIEDQELNGRINVAYESSENLSFNFGYNGRTKQRNYDNQRFGLSIKNPRTEITDVNNLSDFFNKNNLGGAFSTTVIRGLDPANGLEGTNLPGRLENTYGGELEVHALYANAIYKVGEKWTIVPGLRVEAFNQSIEYDVINLAFNNPGREEAKETFILPSVNIKYALNEDQNLRFSVSRTVSNPEFKEVAPYVYENVTDRIGGNPSLLSDPTFSSIINLDLKYEWFFERGQVFSIAAFAKQINDPINLVSANDATGTQRFFRTGNKAEVFGIEFEARKALLLNAEEKSLLSTGLNITYTATKQDLNEKVSGSFNTIFNRDSGSDQLQGASPFLINADVSYTPTFGNYKPVANLVFSYFSDRIDALGAGKLGNIVEKGVPTLDFVWKNKVQDNFEINLSVKNLLNPVIERVRENAQVSEDVLTALDIPFTTDENGKINPLDEFVLSSYKRGVNIGLQFKYTF